MATRRGASCQPQGTCSGRPALAPTVPTECLTQVTSFPFHSVLQPAKSLFSAAGQA